MPLSQFTMPRRITRDARTGREVWQLTSGDFECVTPYMDRFAWSRDDRYIVFMCNRSGAWQPYRLEVETGIATQLLEIADPSAHGFYGIALDLAHNECYVPSGHTFVAIDMDTLRSRVAADFGSVTFFKPGSRQPVLSGDGSLVYAAARTTDDKPMAVIARTDNSGQIQQIPIHPDWMRPCHEQFCPTDNNIVSICGLPDFQDDVNAPAEKRVREWRLDRDTGRIRPLVLMPPGYRATHCIWGRSGKRFYFHRKTSPWYVWVPTALCSVDAEGNDLRVYYETSEHKLGHSCPSPDEQWIVTDSQDPDENILMLVHTQRNEQHMLCWPNMSIDAKTTKRPDKRRPDLPPHTHRHVHPAFSTTGRYIHYVSDVDGNSHVYAVRVDDIVK
jgi:hypothetical protein